MSDGFNPREATNALISSVRFFRDCSEMFLSLVDEVKTYTFEYSWGGASEYNGYVDKNGFECVGRFVYRQTASDPYRFISMVVSPSSESVKRISQSYRIICDQLGVNPMLPLLLAYGSFQVKDENGFRDNYRLRNWCYNIFRLGVLDSEAAGDISQYRFRQDITYIPAAGTDPYYCEGARFRIIPIWEIHDANEVSKLAEEIRNFPGGANKGKQNRRNL